MSDSFVTLWTVALQAPLSKAFSWQEYCSGLPCPPPRHLPDPGIEPTSLMSPALAGGFFTTSTTWEAPSKEQVSFNFMAVATICSDFGGQENKIWQEYWSGLPFPLLVTMFCQNASL